MKNFYFIEEEVKKVLAQHKVQFAYVFGSYAEGRAKKKSDLDIAVYSEEHSPNKRFNIRLNLIKELSTIFFPTRVDVVVLNDTRSSTLRYDIVSHGRLIYEKNASARINYELHVMREYEDFSPFLEVYNKQYLKITL